MLFETNTFLLYLAAAATLVAAPGPGQALVTAKTLAYGVRAGVLTSVGLNVGTLLHAVAAALGLSALLASSELAFTVVKFAGAAYLIVLGVRGLAARASPDSGAAATTSTPGSRSLFSQALLTGILNPKVALFFVAFLPQFVDPRRGLVFLQFFILGAILAIMGVVGDSMVAVVVSAVRRGLERTSAFALWRERVMGAVLVGLGLRLAFVTRK